MIFDNNRKNHADDAERKQDMKISENSKGKAHESKTITKYMMPRVKRNSSCNIYNNIVNQEQEQVKNKNKKNDDADIPVSLWLDKISTLATLNITKEEWNTSIVISQENFLLLR